MSTFKVQELDEFELFSPFLKKSTQSLEFNLHQAIGQKDHWFILNGIQDWRRQQTLGMG
jgi:hypothetical protein